MVGRNITEAMVREALRPQVRELADHIGLERAMRLVETLGGLPTYVPHIVAPDSSICQLIDQDLAEALAPIYGGDYLQLPLSRRAMVLWLASKGWTGARIAARLRCAQRTVQRMIAAAESGGTEGGADAPATPIPSPQLDLFASLV